MSKAEIILEAEKIHKNFDGLVALDGATVFVEKNKIFSLIGPNGSGKTTLFNVITGWLTKTNPRNPEEGDFDDGDVVQEGFFDRQKMKSHKDKGTPLPKKFISQDTGHVKFEQKRIDGMSAHEISLSGLMRTFQTTRNWPKLTVLENLLVAPPMQVGEKILNVFFRRGDIKRQERVNTLKAIEILHFLEISHIRDRISNELSGGQLKLVAIGRLLMSAPRLILLDEPLAGVNPTLGNKIMDKIVELKKYHSIFLIEHDMDVVFNFSDEIYVMARGKVIAKGSPDEIQNNKEVIEAYLGADY
jgi:ABC-type branched-subunit amino acid transport system ATPase component